MEDDGEETTTSSKEGTQEFPLLSLPSELVTHFFSVMPMKDRMRARVCQALSKIEASTPCYFKELEIYEDDSDQSTRICFTDHKSYTATPSNEYPLEYIGRVARVTTVGEMTIVVDDWERYLLNLHGIINELKHIGTLTILDKDKTTTDQFLVDALFLDLSRKCVEIHLNELGSVSTDALYDVYKSIIAGSGPLLHLFVQEIKKETSEALLGLMGITYRDGAVYSNRRDIQVFARIFPSSGFSLSVIIQGVELSLIIRDNGEKDVSFRFRSDKFPYSREYKKYEEEYKEGERENRLEIRLL